MAQEDKGLVMRGIFLLALIGVLVTFVLAMIFWHPHTTTPSLETPPEHLIAAVVVPNVAGTPAHVSWLPLFQLSQTLPSAPGWGTRYNATAALARRGSAYVEWPTIAEMLDEKQQLRNQRVRMPDGKDVYDEGTARSFTLVALKVLAIWHEKQPTDKRTAPADLLAIYAQVDELAKSPHADVKEQAEKTRGAFFRVPGKTTGPRD